MTTKLRLGPLPNKGLVKLTITLPFGLKDQLDTYAQLHSRVWGESVDATELIPHMLNQFILRDKAFKAAMRRKASSQSPLKTLDEP
jgi:hypothetical protein